jgi:riboflavin kinase/FMN adenylyltransferase
VLESLGVEVTRLIAFDRAFSRITAEAFVHQLVRDFAPLHSLSVGADFTFGHRRGGNLEGLVRMGCASGFEVHGLEPVTLGGEPVSSTRIREAIRAGDLSGATAMLGRPYSLVGPVVRGDQMGRRMGVPTANLAVAGMALPPDGVYAVEVRLDGGLLRPGVLNIGERPTLRAPLPTRRFEVHLIDFEGDLYERELEVVFRRRLRDEKRFESMAALEVQIRRDIEAAGELLGGGSKEAVG